MPRKRGVDTECVALARHFIADHADEYTDEQLTELAEEIQGAIEDWFASQEVRDAR